MKIVRPRRRPRRKTTARPQVRVPPELEDAAHQIGAFMEYWGFKAIHGRIWTHLFLAADPLDASDLVQRLGVSKALISVSLGELMEYDVVRSAGKCPRGTNAFAANPQVTDVIMNVLRMRERRMLCRVLACVRQIPNLPEADREAAAIDPKRAALLLEMAETADGTLDSMLKLSEVGFQRWSCFNLPEEGPPEEGPN